MLIWKSPGASIRLQWTFDAQRRSALEHSARIVAHCNFSVYLRMVVSVCICEAVAIRQDLANILQVQGLSKESLRYGDRVARFDEFDARNREIDCTCPAITPRL